MRNTNIKQATRIIPGACLIAVLLCACTSSTTTENTAFPYYRLSTTSDAGTKYLQAIGPTIGVFEFEADYPSPSRFGRSLDWEITDMANEAVNQVRRIYSRDEFQNGDHIEISPADGTMQSFAMIRAINQTENGDWFFERQSSGACHMKSSVLGSELVLSANTVPGSQVVMMAAVDASLNQEWIIEPFGKPTDGIAALCNGVPD